MKLRHKIGIGILATLGLGLLLVFIGMTIHAVVNYNNWVGVILVGFILLIFTALYLMEFE